MGNDIINPFHTKIIIHGDNISEWTRGLAYRVIVMGSEYLEKAIPNNTHTLSDVDLYKVADDILDFLYQ